MGAHTAWGARRSHRWRGGRPLADTTNLLRTLWSRHGGWWPWVVLVLGCALTWQEHQESVQQAARLEQVQFDTRLKAMTLGLERRLQSNTDLLRGVAGLFASSQQVSGEEFSTYVRGLQLAENYPGILGVGFSRWVVPTELPGHVEQMRRDGHPLYDIKPNQTRAAYSSIVFLEPFNWRNQRALGFDMYSDPVRADAMKKAVESGQASVSGKVRLVQEVETDVQAGFLIYVPVYRKATDLHSPKARWGALQGWAYSPVRAGDLVRDHLQRAHPQLETEAVLTLYTADQPLPEHVVYRTPDDIGGPRPSGASAPTHQTLNVLGAQWLVQGHRRHNTTTPAFKPEVWVTGGLLTALLALLVHVAHRSHTQVSLALERTLAVNEQLARNQDAMRLASRVMEASPLGIVVTDPQRRIMSANPSFERITGYPATQALGQDVSMLLTDRQATEQQRLWDALQHFGSAEGELDSRRRDGSLYPAAFTVTQVHDEAGRCSQLVAIFQDITERRKADERIRHLAHHDYLTGLPNRAMLVDRATQALLSAQRYGLRPAVLFMDLDRFKPINDTYGHDAGDAVLIEVAQRLRAVLRETDLVCRQGGDEFVVLLPDHNSPEDLTDLAHKLLQAIEVPYTFNDTALQIDASIGIAMYPDHGTTVDALIQTADSTMYLAKQATSTRVVVAPPATPPT